MSQFDEKIGNFGNISGYTSAFILDFGEITVIEFSKIGNACFIYDQSEARKIISDFWMKEYFLISRLKQRQAGTRILHNRGWQQEMEGILAKWGVRASWRRS